MSLIYNSVNEVKVVGAQALRQFATPAPLGRFHKPTSFAEFAELVEHRAQRAGFTIDTSEYAVSKDGQRMFGMIEIAREGDYISAEEWRYQIGLRSSHDQSLPMGLTMGTRVLVCSNLCFSGDFGRLDTKNTLYKLDRLPLLVEDAITRLPALMQREELRRDVYKMREWKPRVGDAALVEVYKRGGLTAAQLGRAIDQWNAPLHEEHAQDGYNVWRCWNAVTEALKPTGTTNSMNLVRERSIIATTFFDEAVGL